MSPRLFGSSGIRGIANIDITPFLAQRVGAALATMHPGGTVVVGRDTRVTGEMLETALTAGMASGGVDALLVGVAPTPVAAWMIGETGSQAGVVISASHNPPEYNGLKVFNGRGMSFTELEQDAIEGIMEKGEYQLAPWDGVGTVEETDAIGPYIDSILDAINLERDWRVACDLFCGATCNVAPEAFEESGVDATMINSHADGHFPAGRPEPDAESLKRLGKLIRGVGAEVGFGFDGDGDRMMALDELGVVVSPDRLLAGFAGYVVEALGGGVVVTHVGASMSVDEMVEAAEGSVVRTRVGDAHITEAMERHEAVFGGEPVGAWVHPDVHMCPDGVLSALKLLEALERRGKTLSEFVADVPEYPLGRLKIECPNERKARVMEAVSEGYGKAYGEVRSVSTVDGVRLELDEGWVLVRPSGTEPLIRVTAEGKNQKAVDSLLRRGRTLVQDILG